MCDCSCWMLLLWLEAMLLRTKTVTLWTLTLKQWAERSWNTQKSWGGLQSQLIILCVFVTSTSFTLHMIILSINIQILIRAALNIQTSPFTWAFHSVNIGAILHVGFIVEESPPVTFLFKKQRQPSVGYIDLVS